MLDWNKCDLGFFESGVKVLQRNLLLRGLQNSRIFTCRLMFELKLIGTIKIVIVLN